MRCHLGKHYLEHHGNPWLLLSADIGLRRCPLLLMTFPDQSHIDQVRDALWKSSRGASVMVGAGFTRNAILVSPDSAIPPTMHDLEQAIFDKLYPRNSQGTGENGSSRSTVTASFPSLAQEYEVAIGRGALRHFLKSQIRDNELEPSDIHIRLLKLPWEDVFTTNWDTLLERARPSVPELKYTVVQNKDEIPLVAKPRIVKLHGSFPSQFPLVCTEEDYRTYQAKNAPLVNTVQQSMMETVFLLVGFSGDDPNFLQWTGWVRDNLGDSAPKLYLAGWLNLSAHRRKMLENRNVVPIDLANHPKAAKWPRTHCHQKAVNWILHSLEAGRPYTIEDWPTPKEPRFASIPEDLQPVEQLGYDVPKKEISPPSDPETDPLNGDSILSIWAHNRRLYPGWLTVPDSVWQNLWRYTDRWEPIILQVVPHMEAMHGLDAVHELFWRLEIQMGPISNKLETVAQEVLGRIDCQARSVDGQCIANIDWANARKKYRAVVLALVTVARYRFDHRTFKKRIDSLQDFRSDHPDVEHRIHHEECLWAVYSMNFDSISNCLDKWVTENCDPIWMIRKAGLLFETNRISDARELSTRALEIIRGLPNDSRSVAVPSREGWSLALEYAMVPKLKPTQTELARFVGKRRELAHLKCDIYPEIQATANRLEETGKNKDTPPFDIGRGKTTTISFSNAEQYRRAVAYRAVRLSEIAGLPAFFPKPFKAAAEELSKQEPDLAARLILRSVRDDEDPYLKRILSRSRIAVMPVYLAAKLAKTCVNSIEYMVPRLGIQDDLTRAISWVERMQVAMEVLSRLVVRLDPESAEKQFNLALEFYHNAEITRRMWLHKPLHNLLIRSWQSLPEHRRTACLLELLGAPILGMNQSKGTFRLFPKPTEFDSINTQPPDRSIDNEAQWHQIVRRLVRGLRRGGKVRERASQWISTISTWDRFTESESVSLAQALWSNEYVMPDGMPGQTSFQDWAFIVLPEPMQGIAEMRFRAKWLSASTLLPGDIDAIEEVLYQVGRALAGLRFHKYQFDLSEDERNHLAEIVRHWTNIPVPNEAGFFTPHSTLKALHGLRSVLTEIQIPKETAEKLFQKIKEFHTHGVPAFRLIPGLIGAMPDRYEELAEFMKLGLFSEEPKLAVGAMYGLSHWLIGQAETAISLEAPPEELVREIGIIVATRREVSLEAALQVARWVFEDGTETHREAIHRLILQGLDGLAKELSYGREGIQESYDLPRLRLLCVQLSLAMANRGLEHNPTVYQWLESAKTDPLPEIRYAARSSTG